MPDGIERALLRAGEGLGQRATRRRALERAAIGLGVLLGLPSGRAAAARRRFPPGSNPIAGGYYGFCGHIFTTRPARRPRAAAHRRPRHPLRTTDGRPIDNLGRLMDHTGKPVGEDGKRLQGPDGVAARRRPPHPHLRGLGAASARRRRRACRARGTAAATARSESSGLLRHRRQRINGDAALHGYCYGQRSVFCVTYQDTGVPC